MSWSTITNSVVSGGIGVTAATVIVAGYRLGRTHSAWRDVHEARRALRTTRRDALAHTIQFITSAVLILAMLFAAAFNAAR
jgi:hypothetical protein